MRIQGGGQGVNDPIFEKGGIKQISLIPLLLETNRKVYCNLFSSRYKANFLVKSAYSLGIERILNFLKCVNIIFVLCLCVCTVQCQLMMGGGGNVSPLI